MPIGLLPSPVLSPASRHKQQQERAGLDGEPLVIKQASLRQREAQEEGVGEQDFVIAAAIPASSRAVEGSRPEAAAPGAAEAAPTAADPAVAGEEPDVAGSAAEVHAICMDDSLAATAANPSDGSTLPAGHVGAAAMAPPEAGGAAATACRSLEFGSSPAVLAIRSLEACQDSSPAVAPPLAPPSAPSLPSSSPARSVNKEGRAASFRRSLSKKLSRGMSRLRRSIRRKVSRTDSPPLPPARDLGVRGTHSPGATLPPIPESAAEAEGPTTGAGFPTHGHMPAEHAEPASPLQAGLGALSALPPPPAAASGAEVAGAEVADGEVAPAAFVDVDLGQGPALQQQGRRAFQFPGRFACACFAAPMR